VLGRAPFLLPLSTHNAFLVALSNLFQGAFDLGRHRDEAWFLDSIKPETASFLAAIREEFDFLSAPRAPGEPLRTGRLMKPALSAVLAAFGSNF